MNNKDFVEFLDGIPSGVSKDTILEQWNTFYLKNKLSSTDNQDEQYKIMLDFIDAPFRLDKHFADIVKDILSEYKHILEKIYKEEHHNRYFK
jgi:hypothetical protein